MVKNCPKCGKIFHFINNSICDSCIKNEQEIYEKVRLHLKDRPGLSLMDLSNETGVSSKKILKYIKEGRLELLNPEAECEKCSKKIKKGRFCQDCMDNLAKSTFEAVAKFKSESKASKGQKMFTDRGRK